MECLFCVKNLEDERHWVNINHRHHTYQQDLQYSDLDACLKSLPLCNSGTMLSWSSRAVLKLIKNSHDNWPVSLHKIIRRMMLPFQKTAKCHRMNYIKQAEAHLQHGHGGNYRSSSTDIHLGAYTLVNQLLFNKEMSSDSFSLHLKKLSERTKEPFTFLSACINTELHLLTSEKLQCFRASCKREHYHLRLTESKATLTSQIPVEGDLGIWFISSSADLLNQLPRHSELHWSHTDMPVRLARGRLATLLWAPCGSSARLFT